MQLVNDEWHPGSPLRFCWTFFSSSGTNYLLISDVMLCFITLTHSFLLCTIYQEFRSTILRSFGKSDIFLFWHNEIRPTFWWHQHFTNNLAGRTAQSNLFYNLLHILSLHLRLVGICNHIDSCTSYFNQIQCYHCYSPLFLHELHVHWYTSSWQIRHSLYILCMAFCTEWRLQES